MPLRQWDFPGSFGAVPVTPAYALPDIASWDFNDGTKGPYEDFGVASITYPNDPTSSGRGKVARILYSPGAGLSSSDQAVHYVAGTHHYRYGETIWFKGDLYIPSTLSDGVTPKITTQNDDARKLIDIFEGPPNCRLIIERSHGALVYFVCQIEDDGVFHTDITIGNTGIMLLDDTWYTIQMRLKLNSADRIKDGILDLYINSATPSFSLTTGIQMITQGLNGGTSDQQTLFNAGGSYLGDQFTVGSQLTTLPGESGYSEYRYWDNVSLSTQRIG